MPLPMEKCVLVAIRDGQFPEALNSSVFSVSHLSVNFVNHFIFQKWMKLLLNGVGILCYFRSLLPI